LQRDSVINWLREDIPAWGWMLETWRSGRAAGSYYFRPEDILKALDSFFSDWSNHGGEQPLLFNQIIFPYEPEGGDEEIIRLKNSAMQHLLARDSNWVVIDSEGGEWKWHWKLSRFNWLEALDV